ncbi:MAG: hypothetical protein KDE59_18505 [Anaerolineales bacterium]|nr:hypothetical protein [Anaerolineales bacterium]MCB0031431.1 hypothetical protein [Anaerolineales bacterium]
MSQRRIFVFWLPLLASWLLMTGEGPVVSAIINRLPNEVIMLAAQGIAVSLSVFIESPIINMLSTGTAMVKDHASYVLVRNFTLQWLVLLTIVTIIVAFTPVFDLVVSGWLQAPPEVAVWVRPGLKIMTFWSAAIGWRRFLQGVLIGFDRTRYIAYGTAVRLAATALTAISLAVGTDWAGAIIGPTALMVGVFFEALMATWAIRPLLKNELAPAAAVSSAESALTWSALFWFHLPLVGTSALALSAQPIIASTLARLANPTQTLAAWPIVFQLMLLLRAPALAIPEVTIALLREKDSFDAIRKFSLRLTGITLAMTALIALTPIASFYLYQVQDAAQDVGQIARDGLGVFLFMPPLMVLVSWLRGVLIHVRATPTVNLGMAVNLATMIVVLVVGVAQQWDGMVTGALSLTLALLLEFGFLFWKTQGRLRRPLLRPVPAS